MTGNPRGLPGRPDLEMMRLPQVVRAQLHRARSSRVITSGSADIEERVREALYGKTYYGTQRHVFTHLLGGRR